MNSINLVLALARTQLDYFWLLPVVLVPVLTKKGLWNSFQEELGE